MPKTTKILQMVRVEGAFHVLNITVACTIPGDLTVNDATVQWHVFQRYGTVHPALA